MSVPSFEELLTQARQASEEEAGARSSTLLAKGLSGFAEKLLLTSPEKRERFEGFLTPEGKFERQPFTTGQTVAERGFSRLFGTQQKALPTDAIPLTGEQATKFMTEQLLQTQKEEAQSRLEEKKQTGRLDILKERAKIESKNRPVLATEKMNKAQSDYFRAKIGLPDDSQDIDRLTYGFVDRALRERFGSSAEEFKEMNIELQIGRGLFGEIKPEVEQKVKGKLESRKFKKFPQSQNQSQQKMIRVRKISTGQTGSIPENEFDSNYERLE